MDDTIRPVKQAELDETLIDKKDEENPILGTDPATGEDYDLDDIAEKLGLKKQDPNNPTALNMRADLESDEVNNH
jgi:hypothetical protein